MKYSFRNDYNQIGHVQILETLVRYASVINNGYGFDDVSMRLEKKVRDIVKEDVNVYLLAGGTQTNMVALSKMMKPYEAVLACISGHIEVHETGAVEGSGHKIITVSGDNGKVTADEVKEILSLYNDPHMVKIKAVYISNSTEVGSIYTKNELLSLYNVCKENNLYLFLDGARLPIALSAKTNDLSLEDIAKYTDAFYIGGTKNGMPFGEMLIIKDKVINEDFRYHLKNKGAMLSKTFVLSYMFEEYFKDDLYLNLAKNANDMAEYLRNNLKKNGLNIVYPNNTNQIFIELENKVIGAIKKDYEFEMWEEGKEKSVIRLVTTFNTDIEACDSLLQDLKANLN